MVAVAVAVSDVRTRRHVLDLLTSRGPERPSLPLDAPVEIDSQPEQILAWLTNTFGANPDGMLVLISDQLVEGAGNVSGTLLARECQAITGRYAFGSLAIMDRPTRVRDIDRTIRPDISQRDLDSCLALVIDRVRYISPPEAHDQNASGYFLIRTLKASNEGEFLNYFRLRHRVYTIMGYLDEDIERSRSRLEMNEADVRAIHIGAFCRSGVRETLVGCARIVTTEPPNASFQAMFQALAGDDPVVRQRLTEPYPLLLPVFQSHAALNEIMYSALSRSQSCGELSRVIVERDFRGRGISHRLIDEALRMGANRSISRLFLECLRGHEKLYKTHGFKALPGAEGPVVDVYRTMVSMELEQSWTGGRHEEPAIRDHY